jgi:hypothetical protein
MTGIRRHVAALGLTAVLAMAAGCGDEESPADGDVEGVGIVRAGSTAQFASCRDWRDGTEEQRYATIEDIRGQLTPQGSESEESDLSDERAYEIFDHTCANDWAAALRLYKLYARAQAFAPLTGGE